MLYQESERNAIEQKQIAVLLNETQQVVNRLTESNSQMMSQDFSICIGWGRVKICLTVEEN